MGGTVLKIMRRLLLGRIKRRARLKVGITIGVHIRPKWSPSKLGAETESKANAERRKNGS